MSEGVGPEDVQAIIDRSPYLTWLGLNVLSLGGERISASATWRPEWVANPDRGQTQGGILAALIDALDSEDMIEGRGGFSAALVIIGYFLIWEGAVQHFGEGIIGSLTDTVAVAAGALIGLAAWLRQGWKVAIGAAVVAAMWVHGKRGRK